MVTPEPGLERHEWESMLATVEPELEEAPAEAIADLHHIVESMLVARGYDVDDPVRQEDENPEVVAEFRAARDVTQALERGEDVDAEDVATAIESYRNAFDALLAELPK